MMFMLSPANGWRFSGMVLSLIYLCVQSVLEALAAWLLTNPLHKEQALHIALLSIYRAAAPLTHKSSEMWRTSCQRLQACSAAH